MKETKDLIISVFLGPFGIDRMANKCYKTGILKLATLVVPPLNFVVTWADVGSLYLRGHLIGCSMTPPLERKSKNNKKNSQQGGKRTRRRRKKQGGTRKKY